MKYFKFNLKLVTNVIAFVLLLTITTAQSQANQIAITDSLISELNATSEDDQKARLLIQLSDAYAKVSPEESLKHGNQAKDLALKIDDTNLKGLALKAIGGAKVKLWKIDEALEDLNQAYALFKNTENEDEQQRCLVLIGVAYFQKGKYAKAMEFFHKALNVFGKDNESIETANILSNIGNVHGMEKNLDKAIQYNQESLALFRKLNHNDGLTKALLNLGSQYSLKKEYDKAIKLYQEALPMTKLTNDKTTELLVLMNLGNRYSKKEKFELSMSYFQKALEVSAQLNNDEQTAKIYYNIASLQKNQSRYDKAIFYANKSLSLLDEVGEAKWVSYNYRLLVSCYEANGQYKEAFEINKLYHEIKSSLHNSEKSEKILELSAKYETEKKEFENQVLKDEQLKNEAIIKQQKTQSILIGLTTFLLLLVLATLFKNYRDKLKYTQNLEREVTERTSELKTSNSKLLKSNQELEKFAYIASHDLKTPLLNIISFTDLLEKQLENNAGPKTDKYLDIIKTGGKRMYSLIEDVLEYSKISGFENEINNEKIDLNNLCDEIKSNVHSTLNKPKAVIEIVEPLPIIYSNYSSFFLLFKNLIQNGIKYNESPTPEVKIYSKNDADTFSVFFEDNGIGVSKEYFTKIWDMFSRLHTHSEYEGTGLGLATCKKIMDQLKGSIHLSSEVGKGSVFEIRIPNSHLSKNHT